MVSEMAVRGKLFVIAARASKPFAGARRRRDHEKLPLTAISLGTIR